MSNPITECNLGHLSIPKVRGQAQPIRIRVLTFPEKFDRSSGCSYICSFPRKVEKAELTVLRCDF